MKLYCHSLTRFIYTEICATHIRCCILITQKSLNEKDRNPFP